VGGTFKGSEIQVVLFNEHGLVGKTSRHYVIGTTYSWTVPIPTSSQKNCLIKVNGYDEYNRLVSYDRSDKRFKIEVVRLNSPSDGIRLLI
jgi:hypothetical protein